MGRPGCGSGFVAKDKIGDCTGEFVDEVLIFMRGVVIQRENPVAGLFRHFEYFVILRICEFVRGRPGNINWPISDIAPHFLGAQNMDVVVPYVENTAKNWLRSKMPYLRRRGTRLARRYARRTYKSLRKRYSNRAKKYSRRRKRNRQHTHPTGTVSTSRKKRRMVGERIGTSNCKREAIMSAGPVSDLRECRMYIHNLLHIGKADINERAQDHRLKSIINVRGFRICMTMANKISGRPVQVNMALITPKKNGKLYNQLHANQDGNNHTEDTVEDFFRNPDGNKRSEDFKPTLSALQLHCLPINTDHINVLFHKKFTLAPKDEANGMSAEGSKSYKQLQFYVPMRRQIRFDDEDPSNDVADLDYAHMAQSEVYLVYWFSRLLTTASSGYSNVVEVQREFVTYFRESLDI